MGEGAPPSGLGDGSSSCLFSHYALLGGCPTLGFCGWVFASFLLRITLFSASAYAAAPAPRAPRLATWLPPLPAPPAPARSAGNTASPAPHSGRLGECPILGFGGWVFYPALLHPRPF